jgi:hypothetical protein
MLASPSRRRMVLIDHALADDGLGDAADGLGSALGRDLDLDFEGDVVVVVDAGRHFDVHADILVLELGIDQRADQRRGCAGLIGTCGDGDPRADLHGGFLRVGGADARALQDLGVVVGEQQIQRGRPYGDGKVSGVEMGEIVESGTDRRGGRGGGGAGGGWWWTRWRNCRNWLGAEGCSVTPKLLGHEIPSVFSQFLLTSSTAMSTTTSPRGLSRSSMSCWASSSSSGVPRITMAFWLCTPKTLAVGITLRMRGGDVVEIVLLPGVGQIEGLHGLLVELGAAWRRVFWATKMVLLVTGRQKVFDITPTMRRASSSETLFRSTWMRLEL